MTITIRCAGVSCAYHPILGAILDDGTYRQLIRGYKIHIHSGRAVASCRECGYEKPLIIPFPLPNSNLNR